jgi:single-strand DNA-binding protein
MTEVNAMADFNSVVLVGRLVRDPELKYVGNGSPVCNFSVATSRRFTRDGGQKVEETTFLDVSAWRRLGEICQQFLKKGREVLVMGSLRQSRWTDKETQEPRSKLRVVAQTVQFLGGKREEAAAPAAPAPAEPELPEEPDQGGEA